MNKILIYYVAVITTFMIGCVKEKKPTEGNESSIDMVRTDTDEQPDDGNTEGGGGTTTPLLVTTDSGFSIGCKPKFTKCTIGYFIKGATDDIINEKEVIRNSFKHWSNVTDLTFVECGWESSADIVLEFVRHNRKDATGPGGFDCEVENFRYIYFDDDYTFINTNDNKDIHYNFEFLATHEIGHALGLGHSRRTTDLMYWIPKSKAVLQKDDIAEIQKLYGKPSDNDETNNNGGPKVLCVGQTATYIRPFGGAFSSAAWKVSGGLQVISQIGGTVTIKAISTTPGKLIASACKSIDIATSVYKPGGIAGQSLVCKGSEGKFSISPVFGASSYSWHSSDPTAAKLIPNGTTCIVSNVTKTFTLSVKAVNSCGASTPSTKTVSVATNPDAPCNDGY